MQCKTYSGLVGYKLVYVIDYNGVIWSSFVLAVGYMKRSEEVEKLCQIGWVSTESVRISEVSLFQGLGHMEETVLWERKSVLFREVSLCLERGSNVASFKQCFLQ